MWRQSSLLCDRAVRIMKSKTHVFADSVLCLGGIILHQSKLGKTEFNGILDTRYLKDLDRIDGEPMELEWNISQDSLHWELSTRFKTWWQHITLHSFLLPHPWLKLIWNAAVCIVFFHSILWDQPVEFQREYGDGISRQCCINKIDQTSAIVHAFLTSHAHTSIRQHAEKCT